MKEITFKQFVETFNFREYNEYASTERDKHDTKIVRIYIDNDSLDEWFELGIYDFSIHTWDLIEKILHPDICKSVVSSMTYDTGLDLLKVYLHR